MMESCKLEILNINPVFLFILFAMGYVFGLPLKNPTAGKFIIFGFSGIFIYDAVRDAGMLASAAFLVGVISHHMNFLSVFESLSRLKSEKDHVSFADHSSSNSHEETGPQYQNQSSEKTDETYNKYEDHIKNKRQKKADEQARAYSRKEEEKRKQKEQKKHSSTNHQQQSNSEKAMHEAAERMRREKEQFDREREKFKQEQDSYFAHDNRTPEEILGLSGRYSLDDLKKARRREVSRWNPSNMVNKPKHLVKQAEEEMKRINTAYEKLIKQFE